MKGCTHLPGATAPVACEDCIEETLRIVAALAAPPPSSPPTPDLAALVDAAIEEGRAATRYWQDTRDVLDRPKRAAEKLLEEDAYEAACSDAHRAEDADETAKAIVRLRKLVGDDETDRLMRRGPEAILKGQWS